MKKIIHYIYLFWAVLTFLLTLLLGFLLLVILGKLVPRKRRHGYSNYILRHWSWFWAILIGVRIGSVGWKKEYDDLVSVHVVNHNSFLDTLSAYVTIRSRFKTLAKKELQKVPLMGSVFLTSGIMVDRSSKESRRASFDRMVEEIKGGTSVMIFPEGTQNRTENPLADFYDGAFRLAIETQAPILPSVIINSRRLMPQAKFNKLIPGRIRQFFLEPIPTVGLRMDDLPELKARVIDLMGKKVLAEDPDYPN
ncbi:MAG TPA: 1-acyl-sn-glycerol-3-phosphate acyltransferase [Bacteroidetes bacterium]|nr:1-acyl-sn-glycerol-3-phosphate acyltransferase [Bacteroidota bacterium]